MMVIDKIIEWTNNNPKKLFLIDAIGAVFSAFMLGIVLVKLEAIFGIPKPTLYLLASIPCVFAFYDVYCYYKVDKKLGDFLKGIAIANILYCVLSLSLAIYHRYEIKALGWLYIIVEITIIIIIVMLEMRVARSQDIKS